MKKLLLIVLILAICILAFPQGVMAEGSPVPRTVPVQATYAPVTLAFDAGNWAGTAPGITPWVLSVLTSPNEKVDALYFTVTSSRSWEITGYDNSPPTGHTDGKMQGDHYSLQSDFLIQQGGTGVMGPGFANIVGGSGSPKSILKGGPSNVAQWFYPDIRQPVLANDFGSLTGYGITLYFTCTEAIPS